MKNLFMFLAVLGSIAVGQAQDIIINVQNVTTNCTIQKVDAEGITFTIPPQEALYRMDWDNIKQVFYGGNWVSIDLLRDSVEATIAEAKAAVVDSLSRNTFYTPYQTYLEKAGTNLILGTTLPIAGTLVGGGIIIASKNDVAGRLAGYIILGGAYFAAFICDLSAGNNLIKAQRYLDYTKQTKGLTLGVQATGVGIGYRF